MGKVFLDASSIASRDEDYIKRVKVQRNCIEFEFPEGFTKLRLIEECRALNALDTDDPDNFDLMYDITMQMLVGKTVFVNYIDNNTLNKTLIGKFHITDRYMNLRSADIIDEYPVLVNWLVEFVAGYLGKKFPRSLDDIQARMSERYEPMKNSLKEKTVKSKRAE